MFFTNNVSCTPCIQLHFSCWQTHRFLSWTSKCYWRSIQVHHTSYYAHSLVWAFCIVGIRFYCNFKFVICTNSVTITMWLKYLSFLWSGHTVIHFTYHSIVVSPTCQHHMSSAITSHIIYVRPRPSHNVHHFSYSWSVIDWFFFFSKISPDSSLFRTVFGSAGDTCFFFPAPNSSKNN